MTFSTQNQGNVCLGGSKLARDFYLAHGALKLADCSDFVGSEKFFESGDKTGVDGMLLVSAIIDPFKVRGDVVSLDAVNVVHNRETVRVSNKGVSHQTVNKNRFGKSVGPKTDLKISHATPLGPQNFSVTSLQLSMTPDSHSVKASDAAQIAYFVRGSKLVQMNGSPFFGECGNHAAGCPSGELGLAIKNPSRAQTRGGFAINSTLPPESQATGGIPCR
jgi:hypothetical protein